MRTLSLMLLYILFSFTGVSQDNQKWKDGKGFPSVFQNLRSGFFSGTTNGILIIETSDKQQIILDFQGSEGNLNISEDKDEVYDISEKTYVGKTTSGNTEIWYQTYALANGIGINLNGVWFELSAIDGGCDWIINGLDYSYHEEEDTEYLVIQIYKELELSNWQYIIRTEHTMEPNNINELKSKEKKIKILPNSTLIFAIKKK